MVAVLGAYGSALLLAHATHQHAQLMVLAVVLTLTLERTQRTADRGHRLRTFVLLPVIAVAANGVGHLLVQHPNTGDALFVLAMATSIWVRRFGTVAARSGTLLALPFIALLTTPVVAAPGSSDPALWGALVAVIAFTWVTAVHLMSGTLTAAPSLGAVPSPGPAAGARRPGRAASPSSGEARLLGPVVAPPQPSPSPSTEAEAQLSGQAVRPAQPSASPGAAEPVVPPRLSPAAARRRLPASTRMAVQMGLSLAIAFAAGRWLFPAHWSWVVLTAFIVASGNRGRADVLHKSGLRIAGALAGTVAATLLSGRFGSGSSLAVVAIFVVLALATWLRPLSYAYWAAGITAILALLNGYFGVRGGDVLGQRLEGILLGAAIAVATAWLVLPVRTTDVLRRRTAAALAALSDVLAALLRDPHAVHGAAHRFDGGVEALEQIAAPWRLQRRLRRNPGALGADAIDAVAACRAPVAALAAADPEHLAHPHTAKAIGGLARELGAIRRRIGGKDAPRIDRPAPPAPHDAVGTALAELDAALTALAAVPLGPRGR